MKIVIFGATGNIGRRLAVEALDRGHEVVGVGDDTLLSDASGKSTITFEDYAAALVDELEHPRHVRQRFTVAY